MIWLVLRRYRILLAVITVLIAALGIWMYLLGLAYESDLTSHLCTYPAFRCGIYTGAFSIRNQSTALNFLVLFVPCLLGIVFGAPLVAGELEHHTNRLVWTQGISRTKWLVVKWLTVLVLLLLLVSLLTLVASWWAERTYERIPIGTAFAETGRMQPQFFPMTGLAPIGYTLFAFALGAALGAVLRRASWAIVGTIVLYGAISVVMVLLVRPSLVPQVFVPFPSPQAQASVQPFVSDASADTTYQAWELGFGYRYSPSTPTIPNRAAPDAAAERCGESFTDTYTHCLTVHHLQMGTFYQPNSHYWKLQWRETGILVVLSALFFGVTIASVRRWSA